MAKSVSPPNSPVLAVTANTNTPPGEKGQRLYSSTEECELVHDGTAWRKPAASAISSVFGRVGSVAAQLGDYLASQVTNNATHALIPAATYTTVAAALDRIATLLAAKADTSALSGYVTTGRTLTTAAGSGLTGGGDLSTDRTLAVDTTVVVPTSRTLTPGSGILIDGAAAAVNLAANRTISVLRTAGDYLASQVTNNATHALIPAATYTTVAAALDRIATLLAAKADTSALSGYVPTTRTLTTAAGSGLTGGGNLSTDRTLAVDTTVVVPTSRTLTPGSGILIDGAAAAVNLAANRTISVLRAAGDYLASQVTNNATHALIPAATYTTVAAALDRIATLLAAKADTSSLSGYVPTTRTLTTAAGSGLTGGGNLSTDRTLAVDTTVVVPTTRTLTPGSGILIDGAAAAANLAANRTISVLRAAGDYLASQITNDDPATNAENPNVATALGWLAGRVNGVVQSFAGRFGDIDPTAGDYLASQITSDASAASIPPATYPTVKAALDRLASLIAASGTYVASQIGSDLTNLSPSTYPNLRAAIDHLAALANPAPRGAYVHRWVPKLGTTTPIDENFNAAIVAGTAGNSGWAYYCGPYAQYTSAASAGAVAGIKCAGAQVRRGNSANLIDNFTFSARITPHPQLSTHQAVGLFPTTYTPGSPASGTVAANSIWCFIRATSASLFELIAYSKNGAGTVWSASAPGLPLGLTSIDILLEFLASSAGCRISYRLTNNAPNAWTVLGTVPEASLPAANTTLIPCSWAYASAALQAVHWPGVLSLSTFY